MQEESPAMPGMRRGWLERLGIVGMEAIEWPLLASLATEAPLLLIGPHGTAKSLLLTRIAQALGLDWRHYNASLLNFDDLVGFPVPGPDRSLEYVKTPASIWGAGAVIFDEISRCRPDAQNKLFPIIHERRVQGLRLEGLRHRWAAMNPPSRDDSEEAAYAGSEPLDRALADRFGFIVAMPAWSGFSREAQIAVIRAADVPVAPADARHLVSLVARAQALIPGLEAQAGEGIAAYVQSLVALAAQIGLALSPRRANLLYRGILGVAAAAQASAPGAPLADAVLAAVVHGLPQRAEGLPVNGGKLLAIHREALRMADLPEDDPLRAILAATDPLERLQIALGARRLPKSELSRVTADVLAQLPPGAREAAVVHLFETGAVGRLNAAIASQAGELYRGIATPPAFSETLHHGNSRYSAWQRLKDLFAGLDPGNDRAHLQANALASLYARKEIQTAGDAERAFAAFSQADERLVKP